MDTGNIYRDNTDLKESIYDFLLMQQNEAKKLVEYEINFTGDFNSYINKIINLITDGRDDLHSHSVSKFLFYHFNNLMHDLNENAYKIGHTLILDNKYVVEVLQSKNLSYFIEKMLEVSHGDISLLNLSRVSRYNLSEDIKVMNDTKDNLTICKDIYSYFCSNIGCMLQTLLETMHKKHIEKMEKDLAQNTILLI